MGLGELAVSDMNRMTRRAPKSSLPVSGEEGGVHVLSRIRAVMLGLLAMMLVGSFAAASASAEAGPFWHKRAVGGKGEGEKISESAKESFTSKGGTQTLNGKISSTPVEIVANSTEGEGGEIYNNSKQGQIEFKNFYKEPHLVKPELKGCEVKVGKENKVPLKGHLMWKWNGEKKQLEEQPQKEQTVDIGFTVVEPGAQKEEVDFTKDGTFTSITFSGSGCGVLAGTFNVNGSDVAIPNRKLEEFSRTLNVRTLANPRSGSEFNEVYLQHYWNGSAFEGIKLGLVFGSEPASLVGQTENESTTNELAVFEK
jgi:hypothetical protein